jgi:hypothetical protein
MITTMHSDQNASPPRVEVITSVQRRRRWPTAEKIRLVEETMQHGMSVSYLARRAGVAPSLFRQREGDCFSEDHAVFADRADRLRDANGQALAYIYFEDEPAIRSQAAHPGRGPTDRGQYREAAGTPAPWVMRGCRRFALLE